MPDWCPQCNAMLAPGQAVCPRCGAHLGNADQTETGPIGGREIAWLSAYTIAIVLISILVGVAIGLVCLLLYLY